jgi:hypothetical protein
MPKASTVPSVKNEGNMTPNPLTKTEPPMVLVHWADTHLSEGGWLDMDEYEDDGECIVASLGFMVAVGDAGSKKDHVNLWQTLCKGEGIHAIHIPAGMVRSIKILG